MTVLKHLHGTPGANSWPVMVLAHNEERHIEACLDSIFAADPDAPLRVFVMANGCTDKTEEYVASYSGRDPRVNLVSLELGDKCNAWNVFIHEIVPSKCPGQPIYFFMDGDARAIRRSFSNMASAMQKEPQAHAVSAPPASGRSRAHDQEELIRERGLVANLYALRGEFVERCRELGVRIPLRLEGDDGLIAALVRWDLNPKQPMDTRLIAPCAAAGFTFESFKLSQPSHWIAYWKRMVRYGRRRYEFALLGPHLRASGLAAMPRDIRELYVGANRLKLSWNGLYTVTNWFALREMRRLGRSSARTARDVAHVRDQATGR
jgi:glycosyltransferase involved in cell wall biosynthesis